MLRALGRGLHRTTSWAGLGGRLHPLSAPPTAATCAAAPEAWVPYSGPPPPGFSGAGHPLETGVRVSHTAWLRNSVPSGPSVRGHCPFNSPVRVVPGPFSATARARPPIRARARQSPP